VLLIHITFVWIPPLCDLAVQPIRYDIKSSYFILLRKLQHHYLGTFCGQEGLIGGGVAQLIRGTGLVIKRLRNLGSTPDAVARRCVLEKDT